MSEYGRTQNVPYTGQQGSNLVENPRYQGQSTGTLPQDATGPQQESRYGAAPLNTTGLQHGQQHAQQHVQQHGTGQGGYGPPPTTGGYGSDPNTQAGYGSQTTGGYGSNPDARPGHGFQTTGGYGSNPDAQPGHGSQTTSGYGTHPNPQSGYGSQTTGTYGADPNARGTQTGYGSQPTTGGYGTERSAGTVDPNTRTDQSGFGSHPTGGYGSQPTGGFGTTHQQHESQFAQEQPGYGQPGFGAPSEGQHTGALWPQPATPPNAHKHDLTSQGQGGIGQQQAGQGPYGQGGYDQPPRKEGITDKVKDAVGVGPRSHGAAPGQGYNPNVNHPSETTGFGGGQGGYDQPPRKEGITDKVKDAVGVGPRSHGAAPGQGYNPNVNHPSETTGFGGGHGHHPHAGQDQLGGGYNTGLATGADAYTQSPYTQSQPRKEGIADKAKDAVGVGPNSGYDSRTQTGNDAYVHGNHPPGLQDRVQGVNEPSLLGGEHAAGRRDGMLSQGETRTEPGYDASKGHLPGHGGHHQKLGDTGLGGHHNSGTGTTGIDERKGEDTIGSYESKLGTGTGTGTGTGHKTGADTYGGTTGTGSETGSGYDDTTTGTAPPKKGLISKIKDKMHH